MCSNCGKQPAAGSESKCGDCLKFCLRCQGSVTGNAWFCEPCILIDKEYKEAKKKQEQLLRCPKCEDLFGPLDTKGYSAKKLYDCESCSKGSLVADIIRFNVRNRKKIQYEEDHSNDATPEDVERMFSGLRTNSPKKEKGQVLSKETLEEPNPTKGKPASFFKYDARSGPIFEQMQFVWTYYREYSDCPTLVLDWLIKQTSDTEIDFQ